MASHSELAHIGVMHNTGNIVLRIGFQKALHDLQRQLSKADEALTYEFSTAILSLLLDEALRYGEDWIDSTGASDALEYLIQYDISDDLAMLILRDTSDAIYDTLTRNIPDWGNRQYAGHTTYTLKGDYYAIITITPTYFI